MGSNQTRTTMTISMYQASAPRFASMLRNLSAILDKAQAYCEAKKIEPAVLTGSRLYPDMFPLSRQVQIACDTAKGAVARLAGMEIPKQIGRASCRERGEVGGDGGGGQNKKT